MVSRQLEILNTVDVPVRWMSIEPLSFDIAPLLKNSNLQWAVVGAATNGRLTYQPEPEWVQNVLDVLDAQGTKVFFKGNLQWHEWREEFPVIKGRSKLPDVSSPHHQLETMEGYIYSEAAPVYKPAFQK
jgi:protein gp37